MSDSRAQSGAAERARELAPARELARAAEDELAPTAAREPILVVRCGTVPYEEARAMQRRLAGARQRGEVPDVLLLLEHPPVYTRGRRASAAELPLGDEWYVARGIEVRDTDRGGLVTYHGPGQLVAYPIVSLRPYGDDVHEFVRQLERAMIAALGDAGVGAQVLPGWTGVWTEGAAPGGLPREWSSAQPARGEAGAGTGEATGEARKIGAIGLHVSQGVTTHGLAINVNNDLRPFEWVVPCGIEGCRVTSLREELGGAQDLDAFAARLAARYGEVLERGVREGEPADLGLAPATLGSPR